MKPVFFTSLVSGLLLVTQLAFGQAPPVMPEPSQEHAWLDKFSGEWTTHSKATMGPEQPPMECKGTLSSRKLGGFWIMNEMKGDWGGDPMTGIQTLGFDQTTGKYVGTWVDTMTAYMWRYEGSVDPTGKVLTLQADGPNFVESGKLTKFEDIYEFKSEKEMVMTSRMLGSDGKWVTFMSGVATRTK